MVALRICAAMHLACQFKALLGEGEFDLRKRILDVLTRFSGLALRLLWLTWLILS